MKIIFFGTPQFAADVLDFLLKNGIFIEAVVTKPDRWVGRSKELIPNPVKKTALAQNPQIPLFQPEIVSDLSFSPILENFQPDLFVVVAYGEILKTHLLEMPKIGCINLHASLLPKYRGAAPIQRAIMEGEIETGVTIMHMAKKMDAGDIIEMEKVIITPEMTHGELEKKLMESGSKLLLKVIQDFDKGNIKRTPQDHSQASFAPKIELEDCQIDWTKSATQIHNLIRAVNPEPVAWCKLSTKQGEKRLRIFRSLVSDQKSEFSPGAIFTDKSGDIYTACNPGCLKLLEVQLEGKKKMSAKELFRGFPEGPWQTVS